MDQNVGFVLYQHGEEPGTLNATWCHPWFGKGTLGSGRAVGGPGKGFAGNYDIEYFDPDGQRIAGFQLRISKDDSDYFVLEWLEDGEVLDVGVGIQVAEGLAAGWRRLDDSAPDSPIEL